MRMFLFGVQGWAKYSVAIITLVKLFILMSHSGLLFSLYVMKPSFQHRSLVPTYFIVLNKNRFGRPKIDLIF